MKTVFTPRLQRLMRGVREPVLLRPMTRTVLPPVIPQVVPWYAMGAYDSELGASAQPRNNPAFNDAWVIGATGGASRVIPQGIDYSRTPCCTASGAMSGLAEATPLLVGMLALPLALIGFGVALDYFKKGTRNPGGESARTWDDRPIHVPDKQLRSVKRGEKVIPLWGQPFSAAVKSKGRVVGWISVDDLPGGPYTRITDYLKKTGRAYELAQLEIER